MAYNRKELTTQKHRSKDQFLSGSLKAFVATGTTTDIWTDANIDETLRTLTQAIQTRANLVFLGKPNDSTAVGGTNGIFFLTENHGESKDEIQKAVRDAFGTTNGPDWTVTDKLV